MCLALTSMLLPRQRLPLSLFKKTEKMSPGLGFQQENPIRYKLRRRRPPRNYPTERRWVDSSHPTLQLRTPIPAAPPPGRSPSAPCSSRSPRAAGGGLGVHRPRRGAVPLGLRAAPRPRRPRCPPAVPPRCSLRGGSQAGAARQPPADPGPGPRSGPSRPAGPTCAGRLAVLSPPLAARGLRAPGRPAALAPPRPPPPPLPRRALGLRGRLGLLLPRLLLALPLEGPALQPLQQRAGPAVRLRLRPGRLGPRVPRYMEERHA